MTLLYQDQAGGLYVLNKEEEWIAAPPIEGSLVLNVGDLLERWSNNRFVFTKHIVRNHNGQECMSIATFYDPGYSASSIPANWGWTEGKKLCSIRFWPEITLLAEFGAPSKPARFNMGP
ncbi:MAG: 2OG-Fe(II) oxygenase family protein [Alphaproteobacteria bacterium]